RAPGAEAEPGRRGPRAAAGRPPEGEAGPLLKPESAGREQPGEGRGRGQSSARSLLLEGDGPARLQAPTLPGVGGERFAGARGSGRALSAGFYHPRVLAHSTSTDEGEDPLSVWLPVVLQIMSAAPGTPRGKSSLAGVEPMTFPSCAPHCLDQRLGRAIDLAPLAAKKGAGGGRRRACSESRGKHRNGGRAAGSGAAVGAVPAESGPQARVRPTTYRLRGPRRLGFSPRAVVLGFRRSPTPTRL
ncbi:unnamed protein product, partial [Rangifer tarandus platyrhynchus]